MPSNGLYSSCLLSSQCLLVHTTFTLFPCCCSCRPSCAIATSLPIRYPQAGSTQVTESGLAALSIRVWLRGWLGAGSSCAFHSKEGKVFGQRKGARKTRNKWTKEAKQKLEAYPLCRCCWHPSLGWFLWQLWSKQLYCICLSVYLCLCVWCECEELCASRSELRWLGPTCHSGGRFLLSTVWNLCSNSGHDD